MSRAEAAGWALQIAEEIDPEHQELFAKVRLLRSRDLQAPQGLVLRCGEPLRSTGV
jgi:hypothetical protein